MATIIDLFPNYQDSQNSDISERFKRILKKKKNGLKEPLTPELLRKRPGLEDLNDVEAAEIIETIKQLAKTFFEIACFKESNCIDNQHVVSLKQKNKAA